MKFTILALALPAVAVAQPLVTPATETAPAPTGTAPTLKEICEEEAGSYADVCGRCLHRCENTSVPNQCFYSTFMTINMIQSQCWQHGGRDCRNRAVSQSNEQLKSLLRGRLKRNNVEVGSNYT
ncbi:hypothetical protein DL766_003173 [Monosporascus sp. MC13-8B]|nr:hypothetical protein DL766_003173 [Monosporascus sp. MC13-8B]